MNKFLITSIGILLGVAAARGQDALSSPTPAPAGSPAGATATAEQVVVTSQELDISREEIVPSLGATRYTVGPDRIDSQPQGENAPFNQTILRFPGVAQDSFGQLHVRGEHANLQYRIDDVLLPESIPGFGQELETRFADSISLITGALPAQFGFRTTGVIDIHTKNGAVYQQGETSLQVGSFDTINPSFQDGGIYGKLNYYLSTGYLHNGIGIENPTRSSDPIHDDTDQYKLFSYLSYIFDDTSRLTLLISGNHSDFQIPNNPGQIPAFTDMGRSTFDSSKLDENQTEQSSYAILTYQKKAGDLNFQASLFDRYSSILFRPDEVGDLIFNGVASRVDRDILSNGLEFDASYKLNDQHTLRGGLLFNEQHASVGTVTLVFPVDANGNQTSDAPIRVVDNSDKYGYFYGFYLQDEWKPFEQLTINFGGRFDVVDAFSHENQLSPRLNVVYTPSAWTTLHAGYARYFTPPPLENVDQSTIAKFIGTTNEPAVKLNSPVTSERAHYFDVGATQKITDGFNIGLDGYYKSSHSTLDEGQFGQALILSSFNYKRGEIYGAEFTSSYDKGGFSAYFNAAYEWARGTNASSAQFLFDPAELAFIKRNWVFLDHDQRFTGSAGISYMWNDWKAAVSGLYGNGLRRGFANTKKNHPYETFSLSLERRIKITDKKSVLVRFDVVNLFDKIYELRDGSGIGVGAPQFGQRRGFYGTVAYDF
ncbi:MAG: TonB-dependent receptor [Verrucomicrobia bacterium]|nr:MAG: TonB-dependent receptor [Verrucomicrobiota bacterium]